jgi:hypothetical protein
MVASLVQQLAAFASADTQTQGDAVAAAWLHDTIEDTGETPASLKAAGISQRAIEAVIALTRTDEVADDDYYAAVKAQPIALLVKTADLASNLAPERVEQLDGSTRMRLDKKYTHALAERNNWKADGSPRERPFQIVARRLGAFFGDPRREIDILTAHVFAYRGRAAFPDEPLIGRVRALFNGECHSRPLRVT